MNTIREMADYIITSKYAKYDLRKQRRETWEELVSRSEKMHLKKYKNLSPEDKAEIRWAFDLVRQKMVFPSMRGLQFGGQAIEAQELRIYNCLTRHIDSIRAFAEVMFCLLCGGGVGIGVSKQFVNRLPDLVGPSDKNGTIITYVVEDSIEGWADSIEALLNCYTKNNAYSGRKIVFDYSRIRRKGAPLKTSGGKAPGYQPLKNCHKKIKKLLDYIIEVLEIKKLRPIDIYDILMHCSDAVLSGGIRRAATTLLFDLDDTEMMEAKTLCKIDDFGLFEEYKIIRPWSGKEESAFKGAITYKDQLIQVRNLTQFEYDQLKNSKLIGWIHVESQRARSNNSVLLKRDSVTIEQFASIIEKSKQWGEPGFAFYDTPGTLFNPCFELSTIPITSDGRCGLQCCNLTTMNGSRIFDIKTFKDCCKAATIIGTLQAGYTNFKYLGSASRELTEEESLLGVSITGIFDSPKFFLDGDNLKLGASYCVEVNQEWAAKIGINPAARVTVLKPEGTTTLVGESFGSGANPVHAKKFFRRVQANKMDNVYSHFKSVNSHAVEESVWSANKTDDVITFPIQTPDDVITKKDLTAIQHLEYIKLIQKNWVNAGTSEYNKKPIKNSVSCTIIVKEDEWDKVINYVFKNRKFFSAVSFLPETGDKIFPQAPNEEVVTEEDNAKFNALLENFKHVDYTEMIETEDNTEHVMEVSCAGGACIL